MVETASKSVACHSCATLFDSPVIRIGTLEVAEKRVCDSCLEKEEQKAHYERGKRIAFNRETVWSEICPPLYQNTDPSRLLIQAETIQSVLQWQPSERGIGLAGHSGTGKTRLMFMLLRSLHFGDVRVRATTGKAFERWCHRMFEKDDDSRVKIEECRNTKVLFLDDIGKEKYTERVESEFYDLVEYRTSRLLPILWTTNATGDDLIRMMGDDRGEPIVRRLREFSTVISV